MLEAEGGREMTFSEKLITLRAGRGWSQETLARELGVSPAELEPATSRAPVRPIEMRVFAKEGKGDGADE